MIGATHMALPDSGERVSRRSAGIGSGGVSTRAEEARTMPRCGEGTG